MSKLVENPLLPLPGSEGFEQNTYIQLIHYLREISIFVNQLSDGKITATNAQSAAPTTGDHEQGDKVFNDSPTELGSGGSKYVITGWICVASGTPGTWMEMRTLTGN